MPGSEEQFIVGGAAKVLAEKLEVLEEDPKTNVLQVQGTAAAPSLLVVETEPEHAEKLKERFGKSVIIEPNFPVEPL